jgi:hypothetical protein
MQSQADLAFLMQHPALFRNAIAIIEPWEHVGQNSLAACRGNPKLLSEECFRDK